MSAGTSRSRRMACVFSISTRAAVAARRCGSSSSAVAIVERLRRLRAGARAASSRTSSATPPTTSSPPKAIGSGCASLLHPRPGLYARLSEMHDCGLLDRVFPEFDRIHCRVIRDFYHRYTVDEHTLLTIRNIESLWSPATASRERFGSILQEVHAPGAADARAALSRRRQVARRRITRGERAAGADRARSAAAAAPKRASTSSS